MEVTDEQRQEFEDALAAALLLLGHTWTRRTLAYLDLPADGDAVELLPTQHAALLQFAREIAQSVQDGTNARIALGVDASEPPDDIRRAIETYNQQTLLPYIDSYVKHSTVASVMAATDDPQGSGKTAQAAAMWVWSQMTDFDDDCRSAAAAGPATYDDLVSIAGGEPPVHRNCACSLDPVDWSES